MNLIFKQEESVLKKLRVVEYTGFGNKTENGYDDLHINYVNEKIFVH